MSTSGSRDPVTSRAARTCPTTMSRKVSPPRTGSSDFGPVMPIDVPSPPLRRRKAVSLSAASAASSSTSTSDRRGTSVSGSMSDSAIVPEDPPCSWS
jgi:hypothetical protein